MHYWIGLGLMLLVNVLMVGLFAGRHSEKVKQAIKDAAENKIEIAQTHADLTKQIDEIRRDLAARMNRETLQMHFDAIDREFANLNKRLDAVDASIARAGCEYPKCVVGQLLTTAGAKPVDVVRLLDHLRKETP